MYGKMRCHFTLTSKTEGSQIKKRVLVREKFNGRVFRYITKIEAKLNWMLPLILDLLNFASNNRAQAKEKTGLQDCSQIVELKVLKRLISNVMLETMMG